MTAAEQLKQLEQQRERLRQLLYWPTYDHLQEVIRLIQLEVHDKWGHAERPGDLAEMERVFFALRTAAVLLGVTLPEELENVN